MNEDDSSKEETNISRWWRRVTQSWAGGVRTREDLLELLREARDSELMDADALSMFQGVLETAETQVRDIMVPRAQMVVVEADWSIQELLRVVVESGHSRFPVIGDSKDEIIGILLAKDLLRSTTHVPEFDASQFELRRHLRPAVFVPESKRVNMLLKEFKRGRNHMALVVDEYGGIAGLVTIEDVLEQIVGEIEDEHDIDDDDYLIKDLEGDDFTVKAITPIDEFNEHFKTQYRDDEFDTIGGLVMQAFGHLPQREESVDMGNLRFTVLSADGRTIRLLRVAPLDADSDSETTDG